MQTCDSRRDLDAGDVAIAIDMPTDRWPGNCYAVACQMVGRGVIEGRAVYGHYLGPIARESFFAGRRGCPFVRHGWVLRPDGTICDPTRWVFAAEPPAIHFGPASEDGELVYDEGGTQWAMMVQQTKGCPEPSGQTFPVGNEMPADLYATIADLLDVNRFGALDLARLAWLANLPPACFGVQASAFYAWLRQYNLLAAVPIDFRRMIGFE